MIQKGFFFWLFCFNFSSYSYTLEQSHCYIKAWFLLSENKQQCMYLYITMWWFTLIKSLCMGCSIFLNVLPDFVLLYYSRSKQNSQHLYNIFLIAYKVCGLFFKMCCYWVLVTLLSVCHWIQGECFLQIQCVEGMEQHRFICFNLLVWYRCRNTQNYYSCSLPALISLSSSEMALLKLCFFNLHGLSAGLKPGYDVLPVLGGNIHEKTCLIQCIN